MADAGLPLARRFRAAAPQSGRPSGLRGARLVRLVAQMTGLRAEDGVMDLRCGRGQLAAAPLVSEVTAIDPKPEMLWIAETLFGTIDNIRFIPGSSLARRPGEQP